MEDGGSDESDEVPPSHGSASVAGSQPTTQALSGRELGARLLSLLHADMEARGARLVTTGVRGDASKLQASARQEIATVLERCDLQELLRCFDTRCHDSGTSPDQFLRAVFLGSHEDAASSTPSRGAKRIVAFFERALSHFIHNVLTGKKATDVLNVLLTEADNLDGEHFPPLIEQALHVVERSRVDSDSDDDVLLHKSAQSRLGHLSDKSGANAARATVLELVPKFMGRISDTALLACRGVTGDAYKDGVIERLCTATWPRSTVVGLAKTLRDVQISKARLRTVIFKVLSQIGILPVDELPSLVYQLLLLSGRGHRVHVLRGIMREFDLLDEDLPSIDDTGDDDDMTFSQRAVTPAARPKSNQSADQLRRVEGTVITHFNFAAKQDASLGTELLRLFKSGEKLSPFRVGLLLSLARIQRFESKCLAIITHRVLDEFKVRFECITSPWLHDQVGLPGGDTAASHLSAWSVLRDTVTRSRAGWDLVSQPLLQVGVQLLEMAKARDLPLPDLDQAMSAESLETRFMLQYTPAAFAAAVGRDVLVQVFKVHKAVRPPLLEQIFARLAMNDAALPQFISVLARIVSTVDMHVFFDHESAVKEALDYLGTLPSDRAMAFLHAIRPLLVHHQAIRNYTALVLRKAVFARAVQSRVTAVQGFMFLLQHGASGMRSASSVQRLVVDVCGLLRRGLSQQAEVRTAVYAGLSRLSGVRGLRAPLAALLTVHLRRYVNTTNTLAAPFKLASCMSSGVLMEPLGLLLRTVLLFAPPPTADDSEPIHVDGGDSDEGDNGDEVGPMSTSASVWTGSGDQLRQLCQRLLGTELEEYELDKSTDFMQDTDRGARSRALAILLCSVYVACIEQELVARPMKDRTSAGSRLSSGQAAAVLRIFKALQHLRSVCLPKGALSYPKRLATPAVLDAPVLTPSSLICLVRSLATDTDAGDVLRQSPHFVSFVYAACLATVQQYLAQLRGFGVTYRSTEAPRTGADRGAAFHKALSFVSTVAPLVLRELRSLADRDSLSVVGGAAASGAGGAGTGAGTARPGTAKIPTAKDVCRTLLATSKACLQCLLLATDSGMSAANRIEDALGGVMGLEDSTLQGLRTWFEELLAVFFAKKRWKAVEGCFACIRLLLIPDNRLSTSQDQGWSLTLCKDRASSSNTITREALGFLLASNRSSKGCNMLVRAACGLLASLGPAAQPSESEEDDAPTEEFSMLSKDKAAVCVSCVVDGVDHELSMVSSAIARARLIVVVGDDEHAARVRGEKELSVFRRLLVLAHALPPLVKAEIPTGVAAQRVLKTLATFYKMLESATKLVISVRPKFVTPKFQRLVAFVSRNLTKPTYTFLSLLQSEPDMGVNKRKKNKDKGKKRQAKSIEKESRLVPELIFQIEQFEVALIKLSKTAKNLKVQRFVQRSTARDFRLTTTAVKELIAASDHEDSTQGDRDGGKAHVSGNPRPAKRRRRMDDDDGGSVVASGEPYESGDGDSVMDGGGEDLAATGSYAAPRDVQTVEILDNDDDIADEESDEDEASSDGY